LSPKTWIETIAGRLSKSSWIRRKGLQLKIEVYDKLKLWGKITSKDIKNIVGNGINTLWKGAKGGIDSLLDVFSKMTPQAVKKWVHTSPWRMRTFGWLKNLTSKKVYKDIHGVLSPFIKRNLAFRGVYDAARKVDETVKKIPEITKKAVKTAKEITRTAKKTVNKAVNTVKKAVNKVITTAKKVVNKAVNTVKRTVKKAVTTVKKTVQKVVNKAKTATNKAANTVKKAANKAVNTAKKAVKRVTKTAKTVAKKAVNTAKNTGKQIYNGAKKAWNGFKKWIGWR